MPSENASSADNQQERLLTVGWLVGFTDGEGAFTVSIIKNPKCKFGWQVFPEFIVTQGAKSIGVLYLYRDFFNCGNVYVNRRFDNHNDDIYRYCVRALGDLRHEIIPFFQKHRLKTSKSNDFDVFCQVFELIDKNEHLNLEGLYKIAFLAMQMNRKTQPKFLESSHTIRQTQPFRLREEIVASAWRHAGIDINKESLFTLQDNLEEE